MFSKRSVILLFWFYHLHDLWLTTLVFASMTKTVLLLDPNHGFSVTKTSLPSTPECGYFPIHSWTPICSTFSFVIFSWFSFFLTEPQFTVSFADLFSKCNTIWSWVPPGLDLERLFFSIDVLSLDDLTHILGFKIHLHQVPITPSLGWLIC